jgi:hypothetical protein
MTLKKLPVLLASAVKLVRAYDAVEWEVFISEWQKGLQGYASVKRLGGPGDHGRDVIGLCGRQACQGVWDNFQCNHYEGLCRFRRPARTPGKLSSTRSETNSFLLVAVSLSRPVALLHNFATYC